MPDVPALLKVRHKCCLTAAVQHRRCNLLFSAPDIEKYISGVVRGDDRQCWPLSWADRAAAADSADLAYMTSA
jgi:hypothetical protein